VTLVRRGDGRFVAALLVASALAASLAGLARGQTPEAEYRIGPKDVLRITVWGHEDLSRLTVVSADGTFAFPLVGHVSATGLTSSQVEARLKELLGKDYLVDPQVSVAVQEYRSQRVFVLGEAEKPGTYALTGRATLLDILSQAGGPSKTAGRQIVIVRFPKADEPVVPGMPGSVTLRVNLKKLLDGDASENLALQSGDTVFVPKVTSFFVLGEVQRQGAYVMDKETTLLEAVTLAGGFTDRAAPAGAKVLRKRPDGTQETIEIDLSGSDPRARETLLAEGDTLLVPRGNTFFVSGECASRDPTSSRSRRRPSGRSRWRAASPTKPPSPRRS
jgi:polysaccharide export outer membrane protein